MDKVEGDQELCKAVAKAIQAASDDGLLPLTPEPVGEAFFVDFKP